MCIYYANRYASRKSKFGAHFRLLGGGDSPDRAKKNPPPKEAACNSEPIQVGYDSHYSYDWEAREFDGFETADAETTWHTICEERDRRWREVGFDGYVDEMDVLRCVLGETPTYVRGVGQKISTSSSCSFVTSSRQRLQLEQQNEAIQQLH